ncbi:hypothetical protein [Streptomyces acidicola]|uniref:hypothetical protein n=1 Tax=Streptomyces acidicola TaxID=2596892 RepID=UPI0018844D60|nr:hypothetical protein [Streptomyces acidicola]
MLRPAGEREDDDLHLRAVGQAAVVLGLEMLRRRAVTDAQWQLSGDLVAELASGTLTDPGAVTARADRLGSCGAAGTGSAIVSAGAR